MTTPSVQNFSHSDNLISFPDYAIYVACLASYNAGILHGAWIDASQSAEAIWDEIHRILEESPQPNSEEWAIHDYSGFGGLALSEYEDINQIIDIVSFLQEHEPYGEALLAYTGNDIKEAEQYADDYHGQYDSETDFAESLASDIWDIPEHLLFYIDYEKLARDLFINDFLSLESKGNTFVFHHH